MNRLRHHPPAIAAQEDKPEAVALAPLGMLREAWRYLAVSIVALGCDVATLALLAGIGVDHVLATAVGYLVGLAVHYALAIRFVFLHRRYAARRGVETGLYATTGIAGLVLSAAIVAAGGAWGLALAVSKAIAVAASFVTVYAIRRVVLFRQLPGQKADDA